MVVLSRKLANVVELLLRHVSSLHKLFTSDKVGCVNKCVLITTFRPKIFGCFFLDYEVDFCFKNPDPEIRNQMLMIVCFKTMIFLLTQHLDYSMSASGTNTSHGRSTN